MVLFSSFSGLHESGFLSLDETAYLSCAILTTFPVALLYLTVVTSIIVGFYRRRRRRRNHRLRQEYLSTQDIAAQTLEN